MNRNRPPGLEDVCCARLPATALAVLADLRREPEIRVTTAGEHAWVLWPAGDGGADVLRRLLPVSGVELYARRNDGDDPHSDDAKAPWYRPGAHLPAFDVPADLEGHSISLARAVTPLPIRAIRPGGDPPAAVALGLVREPRPRVAGALRSTLAEVGRWAEGAATGELAALQAARAEDRIMLIGRRLPAVAGIRFWGEGVLSPLGFRPEPDLPEAALRRALGIDAGEIVVLEADGFERIPRAAFRPLTRAGVRLAIGPGGPPP